MVFITTFTITGMSLADHTPAWMLRFVADGALAILKFVPNVLGLICYAWVCFFLIDKTISFADDALKKHYMKKLTTNERQIGALPTRLKFFALMVPSWLLKASIGLPMLHVMNLIMSQEPSDIETLGATASGYGWQSAVILQLPKASWVSFTGQPAHQRLIQLILIATFVLFTYSQSSRGFDLVRRTRRVGDIILSYISEGEVTPPTLVTALPALQSKGWSASECQAAGWFLLMINVRITKANDTYENLKPRDYGIYRVVSQAGVASGLTLFHPVVAGLYLAFAMKKGTNLRKTVKVFDKRFAQLPQQVQQDVLTRYADQ
jgi:hypothetical protein